MTLQGHIRSGILLLLAMQVLTSFGGVLLLGRMGPAVGGITGQAIQTLELADHQVYHLILQDKPSFDEDMTTLQELASPENQAILSELTPSIPPAFTGDTTAVRRLLEGLFRIQDVERDRMQAREATAHQLAAAGAWVMVLLGLAGFMANLWVLGRLRSRLVGPLVDLVASVDAAARGDRRRRCRSHQDLAELGDLADAVNRLLDQEPPDAWTGGAPAPATPPALPPERPALLAAMDLLEAPLVYVTAEGSLLAANAQAQELLAGSAGPQVLARLADGADTQPWLDRSLDLPDGHRLLVLKPQVPSPAGE